jgi:fatty-acyl-CoA synthase
VGIIGANHKIFTEGIVAYIKVRDGMTLSKEKIMEHCKEIAAYKRPSLIVFLDEFPLNRVAKTDYLVLKERVEEDIEQARQDGGWDTV